MPTWASPLRLKILVYGALFVIAFATLVPTVSSTINDLVSGRAARAATRPEAPRSSRHGWSSATDPVLGHGYGSVREAIEIPVDNQYLTTGVEGGIVGITAVVSTMAAGLLAASHARRSTHDNRTRDHGLVFASIVAFAIGGIALNTFVFPTIAGIGFLAIGCAGALARLVTEETTNPAIAPKVPRSLVSG